MNPNAYQTSLLQIETLLLLAASQLPSANIARQLGRPIAFDSGTQALLPLPSVVIPPPRPQALQMSDRQRFLMFTRVLFKYLARANVDSRYAKLVVAKCIRQYQHGQCVSLVDTLERELRHYIGEDHWLRVNLCFIAYCRKLGLPTSHVTAMTAV